MTVARDLQDPSTGMICLGKIIGPQGLDGSVRIKSYTTRPQDVASYGTVSDKTGDNQFDINILRSTNKGLVAKISGIEDRGAAEDLRGLELYVARDLLPELKENEYYFSDLIGLEVVDLEDNVIGKVKSVDNFGAGDVMEIVIKGQRSLVLPFSSEAVPFVDTLNGRVTVNLTEKSNLEFALDALEPQ